MVPKGIRDPRRKPDMLHLDNSNHNLKVSWDTSRHSHHSLKRGTINLKDFVPLRKQGNRNTSLLQELGGCFPRVNLTMLTHPGTLRPLQT